MFDPTVCVLTWAQDSSIHPTLGKADWGSLAKVILKDFGAASPSSWRRSHGKVLTPVPNQHTVVILGVHLWEKKAPCLFAWHLFLMMSSNFRPLTVNPFPSRPNSDSLLWITLKISNSWFVGHLCWTLLKHRINWPQQNYQGWAELWKSSVNAKKCPKTTYDSSFLHNLCSLWVNPSVVLTRCSCQTPGYLTPPLGEWWATILALLGDHLVVQPPQFSLLMLSAGNPILRVFGMTQLWIWIHHRCV